MTNTETTSPNTSAPLMCAINAPSANESLISNHAHMGTQGKLGKDAVNVAYYVRE